MAIYHCLSRHLPGKLPGFPWVADDATFPLERGNGHGLLSLNTAVSEQKKEVVC